MPRWLSIFLEYGSGPALAALITASALMWQQSNATRREDERRKDEAAERERDREHQTQLAENASTAEFNRLVLLYEQQVANSWREDRIKMHARALEVFARGFSAVMEFAISAEKLPGNQIHRRADGKGLLGHDLIEHLIETKAQIDLLASETARSHGTDAYQALRDLDAAASLGYRTASEVRRTYTVFIEARSQYQEAARNELGTSM